MFGRKLIDDETADWQLEGFAWLIDRFSTAPGLPDSELWLPTDSHFPSGDGDLAQRLFGHIKSHYGFSPDVSFELIDVDAVTGGNLGGVASVQTVGDTAVGTYQWVVHPDGSQAELIHYRSDMEATELVATFAHELAHAAHLRAHGGDEAFDELYELFTDLTTIYFGFGVFLANSRFEFQGYSGATIQGWQARGAGYLPESDMVFATALFMAIKKIPEDFVRPYLKPRLRKSLKTAFKQLRRYDDRISALRDRQPTFPPSGKYRLESLAI